MLKIINIIKKLLRDCFGLPRNDDLKPPFNKFI